MPLRNWFGRHARASLAFALAGVVALTAGGAIVARQVGTPSRCPPVANQPEWSVARRWDEALLNAIRRALPAPTVHARNLFHTSVAMWDAWAAYDPKATGYFVTEKHTATDVVAARNETISYAAYRVLTSRYIKAVGADQSLSEFDDLMDALCYPLDVTTTDGNSPAALGNRIAAAVLAFGQTDGSNQAGSYADPSYAPVNPPLVVASPGTTLVDPNRWQPLQLERMISQNGIPVENGVQQFVGPHWGGVTGFALPGVGRDRLPMDPGPPPRYGDQAYVDQALDVIRRSSMLDATSDVTIDISPGAFGHRINPSTGQPYAPRVVKQGDFTRALTEFWADGPESETPPGHWNVVANTVSDRLGPDLKIGAQGPALDRLQWDVKLYFALNGAVHDAAIAAWGAKGHYDSARPITMVRYLGGLGQLPLVPGLVEVRPETGETVVRAWKGGGVEWIRAVDWVPYQQPTFVTPAFAGYVSGHSTFSRAAAELMARFTGSEYFPGGVLQETVHAGALRVEPGPSNDVVLEWATYVDAADQAGISRLFGGIHISADDFAGRKLGAECGKAAWALARRYFDGAP